MDRDRVGIVGWSFGGYMAANGVLRRPDVFKAAVAGAPVTDWEDYDTHYTERYMGLLARIEEGLRRGVPDPAGEGPEAAAPARPRHRGRQRLLPAHAEAAPTPCSAPARTSRRLPLPGVTHMYSADPTVMERLWAKTAGFFKTHLGEPK